MAEPDTNPLKISPVETVEDAYANVYDSFEPFEISEEEIFEQVRAAKTPKEAATGSQSFKFKRRQLSFL